MNDNLMTTFLCSTDLRLGTPESTPSCTLTKHQCPLKHNFCPWIHTKLQYICVGDSVHRECGKWRRRSVFSFILSMLYAHWYGGERVAAGGGDAENTPRRTSNMMAPNGPCSMILRLFRRSVCMRRAAARAMSAPLRAPAQPLAARASLLCSRSLFWYNVLAREPCCLRRQAIEKARPKAREQAQQRIRCLQYGVR